MFAHGVGHIDPERAPKHEPAAASGTSGKGDGLHHHEIHEDEGGGFRSKHTHPDGRVEHGEHGTYAEARGHMDQMHGHEEPDGDEDGTSAADDFDADDMAGSYGRAACEE